MVQLQLHDHLPPGCPRSLNHLHGLLLHARHQIHGLTAQTGTVDADQFYNWRRRGAERIHGDDDSEFVYSIGCDWTAFRVSFAGQSATVVPADTGRILAQPRLLKSKHHIDDTLLGCSRLIYHGVSHFQG